MSFRGGMMSQSRPPGKTAPPGQTSSTTSGFGVNSLRTPGPTAASALKPTPKTPTTPSTAGNAQNGTGNKPLQPQAPATVQQPTQQQIQQQPKVQSSAPAVQQPPQKQEPPPQPQQQQQQQQQKSTTPKTQSNSTPATSQPTPAKPPTAQLQQPQQQPPTQPTPAATKAPTVKPTKTSAPETPLPQPVQPEQQTPTAMPPLPAIPLVLDPPSELTFRGSFKHTIAAPMRLTNTSSDTRVCYKLRTTAPHLYCARPSVDVIGPNQTADIKVILQAASVDLADTNVKHKLMVQWISVPEGPIISLDKLWQQSRPQDLSNAKLSCVLERIPEKTAVETPSIVENGFEPIVSQKSYSASYSEPKSDVKSSSKSASPPPSSSSSGILLVILVVVAAMFAALLYNNSQ